MLLQPEFSKLPGVVKNRAQIISRVNGDCRKEQRHHPVRRMNELELQDRPLAKTQAS